MPVSSISAEEVEEILRGGELARAWIARLEAGEVITFPRRRLAIPQGDLEFLLGQHQAESRLHKNIAYKPGIDRLSGVDDKSADKAEVERDARGDAALLHKA